MPLLGHALLLGCATTALWFATLVVVPSAQTSVRQYGTAIPALFQVVFEVQNACDHAVVPISVIGLALFIIALWRRGPVGLVCGCRMALGFLSVAVACLVFYLLCSGGAAYRLASSDQMRETAVYRLALDRYALLEATQGHYEMLRETWRQSRSLKLGEAHNVAEFNNREAAERISSLLAALPKTTDRSARKRILATLCLFRERIPPDSPDARAVAYFAAEFGSPLTDLHAGPFPWIAANLNKDGWDPLPLFKWSL